MELMNFDDDQYKKYASEFAKIDIEGTDYLAFRDMGELLSRYANANRALDYGCGTGRSTRFLKRLGFDTVGIDHTQNMLQQAKLKDDQGEYLHIKSHLPFRDSLFDIIFFCFVLVAVSSKGEMKNILLDAKRVLKEEGIMVIVVTAAESYQGKWASWFFDFSENKTTLASGNKVKILFRGTNVVLFDYYWTDDDYRQIFNDVGLKILKTHRPLGRDDDPFEWLDETIISPIIIYILGK